MDCNYTKQHCALVVSHESLAREVSRLNLVVERLERHAAGRSVRLRDIALTLAGIGVFVMSLVWTFRGLTL